MDDLIDVSGVSGYSRSRAGNPFLSRPNIRTAFWMVRLQLIALDYRVRAAGFVLIISFSVHSGCVIERDRVYSRIGAMMECDPYI